MIGRRRCHATAALALLALVALPGCSGSADEAPTPSAPVRSTTASTSAQTTTSAPAPSPITSSPDEPTTTPPHPVSIEALIQDSYDGGDLQLGEVLAVTESYTRYFATYRSGDLTISAVLNIPTGPGPFPVMVLAHGYIDPAVYTNGRGMMREQDFLARRGFAVLHTDYRNHAQSDDDPAAELNLRLGYTEDVINAVLAIRSAGRPELDPDRIGLFGRSMGGGVVYNALAAQPGLVDAAVVYAPVSSSTAENFNRWTRGDGAVAEEIIRAYGAPEDAPDFWHRASPRPYFGRITEPVLIQHGTADESCPYEWSQATLAAMQSAGVDAELITWPGEPHAFEAAWPESMERTVEFLAEHLTG